MRKAMQWEDRGRGKSRVSERHGGLVTARGSTQQRHEEDNMVSRRQLNSRGQVYGFVRFLYMRNIDKLAHALNNAWISDHRFWAREARFDRFAHHDDQNKVSIRGARGVEKGREVKLVVITHGEGVKNVRVGSGSKGGGGECREGADGGKGGRDVCEEDGGREEGVGTEDVPKGEAKVDAQTSEDIPNGMLLYNSTSEDRLWANGGIVAKVVSGDSSLSLQQRVGDAGFSNIVVTLMESDRVFLHCTRAEDMLQVFNEVYGTPVHAWNELFFKICVSGCGRYIRSDDCTVDRARLDYARVLISTSMLDVINSSSEEWGCNLGEDAFMTEEEKESRTEALSTHNDAPGMEEVQGEIDDLVDDLNKERMKSDEQQNNNIIDACFHSDVLVNAGVQPIAAAVAQEEAGVKKSSLKNASSGTFSKKVNIHITSKSKSSSKPKQKNKAGVVLNQSVGFIKRIARLPSKDRKEILKVLKKQECKRNMLSKASKVMVNSLSNSSNMFNSSVNKDWENWVLLHGKKKVVAEDVMEIGKTFGVKFSGDKNSIFNLLTKKGRRELRAERGCLLVEGAVADDGIQGEGN
ncbi:hypothetical protein MTR_3g049960 [Medicago truncatula]|uniref:DUF4283 domain protein n=1 Tax=Medicago truncatula TaxID=3880 RepID=G7J1C9_MEDTR|nr:hypothetical protein MTR_3g049960 [Medicago truncatula]